MNQQHNDTHERRLKEFDDTLSQLERATQQVQEERREYINRNGLNKPAQEYTKG